MYSFCAMYSLRMSVWIVPRSRPRGTPCSSPTTRYIASAIAADELIVIDVDTPPERDPGEQHPHVLQRVDRHALTADLAERAR